VTHEARAIDVVSSYSTNNGVTWSEPQAAVDADLAAAMGTHRRYSTVSGGDSLTGSVTMQTPH
jgi:Neuraminidase (sialidase)